MRTAAGVNQALVARWRPGCTEWHAQQHSGCTQTLPVAAARPCDMARVSVGNSSCRGQGGCAQPHEDSRHMVMVTIMAGVYR